MKTNKIYEGIYKEGPSKKTDLFIMDENMTIAENKLVHYYLLETIAHNLMLAKQELIPKKSSKKILQALRILLEKCKTESLIDPLLGDVHENIEHTLFETIGEDSGWFHIARSRNDQAVTDQKLFTKKHFLDLFVQLSRLEEILILKAEKFKNIIMPGFTHLRSAMPSSFGFWWQAYLDQILDLHMIMKSVLEMYDKCPLGAGASYGVNWKIDPCFTAKKLGFKAPFINALSAINNRGIEDSVIVSNLAILFVILSRMMEDIIIWSMPEVNYILLSEKYTTGSSIMPQKINPDVAEKVRGKSSSIIAHLNHILIAMKGMPSGYNRDSAESKLAIVNALEESIATILIVCEMFSTIVPNCSIMEKAVVSSLPTKLADELVKKYEFPFRIAHKIVGKAVAFAKGNVLKINKKLVMTSIKETTGKNIEVSNELIKTVLNAKHALDQYQYEGSPNHEYVKKTNYKLSHKITSLKKWSTLSLNNFDSIEVNLLKDVDKLING